jgi:hypothetical protein
MLRSAIANVVRVTGKSEDEARAILAKPSPDGRFVSMDEVAAKVLWWCARRTGDRSVAKGIRQITARVNPALTASRKTG